MTDLRGCAESGPQHCAALVRERAATPCCADVRAGCNTSWRRCHAAETTLSGARTRPWRLISGSGRWFVLVDQAAEDRSTSDPAVDRLGHRWLRAWWT